MWKEIYISLVLNLSQALKFNKTIFFLKSSCPLRSSIPTISKNILALERVVKRKIDKETTASYSHIYLHPKELKLQSQHFRTFRNLRENQSSFLVVYSVISKMWLKIKFCDKSLAVILSLAVFPLHHAVSLYT